MKKLIYTGSGVALVTPMHKDGSINYEKYGELIEFQISHGTDAIIACATTGESPVLNHEEHWNMSFKRETSVFPLSPVQAVTIRPMQYNFLRKQSVWVQMRFSL